MENHRSWQLPAAKHGISSVLCIVSDVEHGSHLPGNPVARLQALLAGQQTPAVLESLFPEVRSLAYLSAGGRSPQRADWLAARVLVFALQHLELASHELALMDAVNLRLQQLSRKLALDCPLLRSFALFCGARPWRTHGHGEQLLSVTASPVAQSLALRRQLGAHLARVQQALAKLA
ncbi:hypothetical protein [Vogesella alkaliphila]|uniref:AraC family transcriptional regulator n=1 Tax=Vogesella alkaliphila TaxID=1193621 RepID=A0ABQ2YW79_9NEIS|nr:hypothetical protein [Vogesella alkaliphila]GGX97419.1 hypothetical protein GCM10011290_26670 [Vogesella alkaliphila]